MEGSDTGREESLDTGFEGSDVASGLNLVTGSDGGLEASSLDAAAVWYSPFQDSLIWMMDGAHNLTGLPW